MTAEAIKRSRWVIVLGLAAVLVGCGESADRKKMKEARAAQESAGQSLATATIMMRSESLAPSNKQSQVAASLEEAEKALRGAMGKAANYWPLQESLGAVLVQSGDYWTMRTGEALDQARRDLNQAIIDLNQLEELEVFVAGWEARKTVYEAARTKLATDKAALQAELKADQGRIQQFNNQKADLEKQAQAKRQLESAARAEAKTLQAAADQDPSNTQKLAAALSKQVAADKLASEAGTLDAQAELAASNASGVKVKADAVASRIEALDTADQRYVQLQAMAEAALAAGADPQGGGLGIQVATKRTALQGELTPIVEVLAAADEASKKAKAAYEEAVRQLQQSLTGLERENRQAASSAPPGADRSAVGGQLSELTVRLELASAHCGLGQLLWTLADNAEMVVQVGQLLATVGQAGPPGIEISAAETRQAAKTSYAAAYPILEAAGSNPLVRRSEQSSLWAKTIERRLAFVQTRAGDALGAVSPGGPPASRGPVPGAP